jgi:vitamin B12 transporter
MKTLRLVVPICLLFVCASRVLPQSRSADAHVSGHLTDPSGAGVGGVRVTAQLENTPNPPLWSATSSTDGAYDLSVPPGRYHLHFTLDPFVTRDAILELGAGASRSLNFRMELQTLSDRVLVTAQAEPIGAQQSSAPNAIVGREEIEQRQAIFFPDLLIYTPGISFGRTGSNGGTASIFLEGGNSSFTKVLVDGTSINPPGGAVDFSILTTDNVDKVEVVRGAESAIYGTDAVSGVVQLFSHRGTTEIPAFTAFSEGGSFSTYRGGGQISGLAGVFDYAASASYFQTDGQYPNTDFINRTLTGNFGYAISETNQLRLAVRNNSGNAGTPGQIGFTPPSLYQRYNQELFSANARWDFATGSHWQNEVMGGEAYTRQHSFNPTQSFYAADPNAFCPQANPGAVATTEFCDYVYDSQYQYNVAIFNAQTTYRVRKLAATAGYQYTVENGSIYYLPEPHVRRNNQAGYLDFRYLPMSRLTFDFGLRAEANGYYGTRVVPRVGGTAALRYGRGFWGDTQLRMFYGQGIKEPRFDQTYGTDACDPGNPNLKPEASKNWSAGIDQKLAGDRIKVSANYFYYRFYDLISFGSAPPPEGCSFYYSYFNTDLAYSRGTSVSAEVRAAKWFFITGNYMYDDTRVVKSPNASDPALIAGNRLIRRPLNSGSITLTATFRRFNAVFAGYFAGVRTDSDFLFLGYRSNPGYARFDFSASYNFYRGLSIYGHATNLFDKQYQDVLGYPALGRDARIGLRYQFPGRN